jgi:hypothetical protein
MSGRLRYLQQYPDHVAIMVNANPDSNGGEKALLAEHKGQIKRFISLGGIAVLPDAVMNRLAVSADIVS